MRGRSYRRRRSASQSQSQRYDGTLKVIDSKGKVRRRSGATSALGRTAPARPSSLHAPAEVKGVALLIVNHPDRASDQWMWIPEIGRERRVALQDRSTRFFGTDFTFEDLEERDVEPVRISSCWLKSPSKALRAGRSNRGHVKGKVSQYTHSYVWIRKDNYAFARIENYKGAKLVRQLQYSDIRRYRASGRHTKWTCMTSAATATPS